MTPSSVLPRTTSGALAALAAVALVAGACSSDTTATGEGSSGDDELALAFSAEDLGGASFEGASLEGTDTVLWFWAPWCTTCRAEADDVVAVAEAFDGDVEVIGVAGRGEVPEMEGFVSDTGTEELRHLVDEDGSIWVSFDVSSQPAFAFIDDSGSVEVVTGSLGEDGLTERMAALRDT